MASNKQPIHPDPTPEEIKAMCKKIQKEWPEHRFRPGLSIPVELDREYHIQGIEDRHVNWF